MIVVESGQGCQREAGQSAAGQPDKNARQIEQEPHYYPDNLESKLNHYQPTGSLYAQSLTTHSSLAGLDRLRRPQARHA
jgi:hypothetical protein